MIATTLLLSAVLATTAPAQFERMGPASPDLLSLKVRDVSLFVRPGESVFVDMDIANLSRMVNGCQALIGYSSVYLTAPHSVTPGGGYWTELIYESWNVPGELDTAIGVQLDGGPSGTDEDGTIAVINLTAGTTEGVAQIVFRQDADANYATMLSGLDTNPVWPNKVDSRQIVIDGTPPDLDITHAEQGGSELLISLGSVVTAIQGTVSFQLTTVDSLAGLFGAPAVSARDSANEALPLVFINESPAGTYNYSLQIGPGAANGLATIVAAAADNAGNIAIDTDRFQINKNQIAGILEISTLSSANYAFERQVAFAASDADGVVLKRWTLLVHFVNNPVTKVASGDYVLTEIPSGTCNLSAKASTSLRRRQSVLLDETGQALAPFTSANGKQLRGGDLNGNNVVNTLDYAILKASWNTLSPNADINGDGSVQLFDYALMKENWFIAGDPE